MTQIICSNLDLPGDEHDEVAAIKDADHDEDDAHPEADPQPEGQVLQAVLAGHKVDQSLEECWWGGQFNGYNFGLYSHLNSCFLYKNMFKN